MDRENYVVHFRNLKFYIQQGVIITRVSRAISFNERSWLAPYINSNTEQRKKARDELEKAFWKLLNNSLFGKCSSSLSSSILLFSVSHPVTIFRENY